MPSANYRGQKRYLKAFLHRVPLMLMGRVPDTTRGGVRAFWIKIGMVALAIIRDAYVLKSRGGTDASGVKWAALASSTIARRLRKAGLPSQAHAIKRLRNAYATVAKTGRGQKKLEQAKALAQKVFGPMQILVDTGRLLASFTPGVKGPDQLFDVLPNGVAVGSNVKTKSGHNLAGIHHRGTATIPMRKLWPEWEQWPSAWQQQIFDAMQDGISDMILRWIRSGGSS